MPLDLFDETWELLAAFEAAGLDYAVAGALALAIHGVPRATTDIDLLVLPEQLDAALAAARARGFRIEAHPMKFPDGMEVRRVTKIEESELLTLDLLLVNQNLESVWQSRQRIDTEKGSFWSISREGLIQMKSWANRPQDLADIQRLEDLDR